MYIKNFAFWLVEKDTLDAYTIPKINELCREKLISILLDYESTYLGLDGDVNYSQEVSFLRGIVCYPTMQIRSVCSWIRNSVFEFLSLSLWIFKNLLAFLLIQSFLQDIYLYYPLDWMTFIHIFRKWRNFDIFLDWMELFGFGFESQKSLFNLERYLVICCHGGGNMTKEKQ